MRPMFWHETDSPVGPLLLAADGRALTRVYFQRGPHPFTPPPEWRREAGRFEASTRQLAEYFAGERRAFDLPLAMEGSEFQRSVWRALVAIPYGETISYGELARRVGSVARAVGLANGANPLPIIVPCHRVIGADGSLTGYGGGLDRKETLLRLEEAPAMIALDATLW
jgi:methylated-DNA-[protein]-cysteine S-methyltransferase